MSQLFDLPLFPLGLVLYPEERVPLHIYEPRYKELARDVMTHGFPFGVILYEEGKMAEVGCTAHIQQVVQEYDDGRIDILVEGRERFRVREIRQEKAYLTADAETVEDLSDEGEPPLLQRVITQHMKLLELAGRTVRPNLYQGARSVSFIIAHNAGLTLQQKQELLELQNEDDRIMYLVRHFETLIPQVEQAESVKKKIRSNGHFKDFPPEKL